MTPTLALLHLVAKAAAAKSSSFVPLLVLLAVALGGYFLFLKPQQRKAQAARANIGAGYEVGDEVQTIGGIIGTILEINGDRYTLLTGNTASDGNLDGVQPTKIVFIRQAIARKVERIVDADVDDDDEVTDIEDDEPDEAEHESDEEAEEA
jgi:preprotein translocase subunit YajC